MSKTMFALLMSGSLLIPHTPALGSEHAGGGLIKLDWLSLDVEAYLPPPVSTVPWLNLDSRTKLPRGDYSIGRLAEGIGPLVLKPTAATQVSSTEQIGKASSDWKW